jgi:hypothetical protein
MDVIFASGRKQLVQHERMRQCNQLPPSVTLGWIHRYAISARLFLLSGGHFARWIERPACMPQGIGRKAAKLDKAKAMSTIAGRLASIKANVGCDFSSCYAVSTPAVVFRAQ